MVGLLVVEAGEGVHVELHPVARHELHQHGLAGHAVAVVVGVVLVVHGPHLLAVPAQGEQHLLHVLGADRDTEHVAACTGHINTVLLSELVTNLCEY